MLKKLWETIKKYLKMFLSAYQPSEETNPDSNPQKQEPKMNLPMSLLRNPAGVPLPESWTPGWKFEAQGTATVMANGQECTGEIQSINPTCFSLKSKMALLEYGLHPVGNYDQFAVRTGAGDKGPGGAMLVMVAINPKTGELMYGTIDEKRPLSVFEQENGITVPMVMRTPPGGFVDPGEDAAKAAMRETMEECGISLDVPLYVGSIVDNRAFFVSRFYEDGRPADNAVAVFTIEVNAKKLVEQADGSYTFLQPEVIPDSLNKAKTLQAVFRNKKDSSDTADGLAIAAISKTQDFYS